MNTPQTTSIDRTTDALHVLLVEDNPGDARLFEEYLQGHNLDLEWTRTLAEGLDALTTASPDIAVVDLGLPDSEGIETVQRCAEAVPSVPVVVLTGEKNLETALAAQQAGAVDYLEKGELSSRLIIRTLRWARERARMEKELQRRQERFQGLAHSIPGVIFQFSAKEEGDYGFSFVSDRAEEMLGIAPDAETFFEEALRRVPDPHRDALIASVEEAVQSASTWRFEAPFVKPSGERIWVLGTSTPVRHDEELVFNGVLLDITERKRAEARTELQTEVFRQVVEGKPLPDILSTLVENIEAMRPGMLGSVLLHDDREGCIRHGAAPSLPASFNEALDGTTVGPEVGSCGTAMYTGEAVVTEDIETDPRWEGFRDLAREHDLRACWSVPIHGAEGDVLGTFAMYYREPKAPSENDRALIDEAQSLARLAIERYRETDQLRLMSQAVEQAREAVLVTEADPIDEPGPRIVYVNSAYEEMTGYTQDEVLGETPRILQGPETDREVLDSLREALEAGRPWEGETVNYRKDGSPYRVHWNVAPVRNEEGDIEYWVSVQRDVTEERAREERLGQMAQALEQVDDKVVITDREGRIQYVNEAFEEITGYREEEVIGETPRILRSGEHEGSFYEDLWETLRSGDTFRAEFTNRRKDGRRYVEDESITPVTDEEGEITHFVSSGRDITERKEQQAALRRQRNLLEQTQRLAGAWEVNRVTDELAWTEEVYRIHEVPPGTDVAVEDALDFYPPDARQTVRDAFRRCVEEGASYDLEVPLITAKGTRRWVRTVGAPAETDDGIIVKIAGAFQDITDRKQAEQELERQNDLFAKAQEMATIGAWEYDVGTDETVWTDVVAQIHGLSSTDPLTPEDSLEFYHPDDRPRVQKAFRRAVQEGESYDLEARLVTENGEERWVRTSGEPQLQGGTVVRVRGTLQDVTQQKEVEERLRDQKERFRVITENVSDAIYRSVPGEGLVYANQAFADMFGYDTVEEVLEIDPSTLYVSAEQRQRLRDQFREEGGFDSVEVTFQRRDGSTFTGLMSGTVVQDEEGEVQSYDGAIADISEQKRRQRVLEERQDKIEALYAATDQLLRAQDRDEVGQSIIELVGNTLEYPGVSVRFEEDGQLVPTHVSPAVESFMPPRPPLAVDGPSIVAQVYKNKETLAVDDVQREDDPTDYGEARAAAAVPLGTHGIIGVTDREPGTIDAFDLRLMEILAAHATAVLDGLDQLQGLREAKEEAERMNRLKSAFLANMSHEIRTPLTSILGFAEAIGEQVEDSDDGTVARFSRLISKSGRRLMETLEGVLNLSKLEAGEMGFSSEPVDLLAEADEVAEQYRPQLDEASVDLTLDADEGAVWAQADEGGVHIVLRNLVSNAIKYTEAGGQVWVRVRDDGDRAVLEVEDTGIGMEPERVPDLFEAFKQASEGVGREYEGTGLGLAVTKKTVEQMGGTIEVETAPGEGSCFTVRLPRGEENEDE